MAKQIPLSGGLKFVLVDDEDYEYLSQFKFRLRNGYPSRITSLKEGLPRKGISMHREIMGLPEGKMVDHANGDKLDNRRCNLRICTRAQNSSNRKKTRGKSRYKGVYTHYKAWRACITVQGKAMRLGTFKTEEEAALVYNKHALHHFGEFALINEVQNVL